MSGLSHLCRALSCDDLGGTLRGLFRGPGGGGARVSGGENKPGGEAGGKKKGYWYSGDTLSLGSGNMRTGGSSSGRGASESARKGARAAYEA